MKEAIIQRRQKKLQALREEMLQWQQVAVNQQLRIERLECNFSALINVLARQGRFARFDIKDFDSEITKIVKARLPKPNGVQQPPQVENVPTGNPAE